MSDIERDESQGSSARERIAVPLRALVAQVRASAARVAATARRRPGAPVDPDAVHDFRVAVRRLRSVLRPVRRLYGRKRMRAVAEGLARIADATSELRDEEALRETLGELEVPASARPTLEAWMARRARAERARRGSVARFVARAVAPATRGGDPTQGELGAVLDHLESRLARKRSRCPELGVILDRALARARADLLAHAGASPDDPSAMHALRIRYKRLRYTADLFASILAPASPGHGGRRAELEAVAKRAARQQKRLGELHDLDEALVRVGRAWGLAEPARSVVLAALRTARTRAAERALTEHRAELVSSAEPG